MTEENTRYRSLSAVGMGADAATEVVLGVLAERKGLVVHRIAPGRIGVARTTRPRWAVVACLCTVWLGGLGLLFLLVKQTEAAEITLGDGPQGCVVVVPPMLLGPVVDDLAAALYGPGPGGATGTPVAFGPPPVGTVDDGMDERTVARTETLPPPPAVAASPPSEARATLTFATGSVVVEAGARLVLGRDPSATGGARAETVPGDASTVSKSHLLAAFDGVTLTVEDLGSTNGSTVVRQADQGGEEPLVPGTAVEIPSGARLRLGALACDVEVLRPGVKP